MAIAVATPSDRRRYTLSEFLTLLLELELAGSQEWYEIIGGELVAHDSTNYPHMRATVRILHFLGDVRLAGYGEEGTDRTVALDYRGPDEPIHDAYKPDAFFVVTARRDMLDRPDIPAVAGAPDLVVEVLSHSTARFDRPPRGKKFLAYERAGVRFYWLVDPRAQTIIQYELREGKLVEVARLGPADTLRCPLFPELSLPLAEVFG